MIAATYIQIIAFITIKQYVYMYILYIYIYIYAAKPQ
jgi:hypothetical protein